MNIDHNVNVVSKFETNNVNDNEHRGMRKVLNSNRIARDLVKLFGTQYLSNPEEDKSWKFYCDMANRLPEDEIRKNIETATRKRAGKPILNPGGYFNRLCQISLYKQKMGQS